MLKASLPGIAKEDTELHVEGKTLVLKAHSRYQNPAGFRQVAAEFEHESYAMSADLPEMADVGTLTAKLENGLLTVAAEEDRNPLTAQQIGYCRFVRGVLPGEKHFGDSRFTWLNDGR